MDPWFSRERRQRRRVGPGLPAGHGYGVSLLPRLAVARELEEGELVALQLAGSLRPVSIVAQCHPRLGLAESSLRALLDLARRADPLAGMPHRLPPGSP
ncbi:LysR substrate-binding domain-containing protein [Streptomyces cinerochromogenes]|uniref:LysR substrate-binding domain-containing protein n=1 Tax=Streptomyces cinerochromogenes TaxID=66422 RepID=UPI0036C0C1BB